MKQRKSKTPFRKRADILWRERFDIEYDYLTPKWYRWSIIRECAVPLIQPFPKLRRKQFTLYDYGHQREKACPRFWKRMHIVKFRRQSRLYILHATHLGTACTRVPPILNRPWIYYW